MEPIIELEALLQIYANPDLVIFDARSGKNSKDQFEVKHLKSALHIDLNTQLAQIKEDVSDGGRHPLPEIGQFAETMSSFGVTKSSHVVVYDDKSGANAAARLWWMLRSAGHEKVQVLNGGPVEAEKKGIAMSSNAQSVISSRSSFRAERWIWPVVDMLTVEKVSQNPEYIVVDVRDKDRYNGLVEPIDLIAGHIPGAINIPYTENLDANGIFKNPHELREKYHSLFGDTSSEKIIVHCGSGVTACHTLLALAHAGLDMPNLYPGSWSEWSRNEKTMVTKAD